MIGRNLYYILEGHDVVLVRDPKVWGKWMDKTNGSVNKTKKGNISVSTVFLGIDHSYGTEQAGQKPILFETMIFGGLHDGYMERYCTWEEAEAGHANMCEMAFDQRNYE